MYKYTLGFIKQGNNILMLNRNKEPWMGNWNGVGGKIELNETPINGMIREIKEETGLIVSEKNIIFKGVVTWNPFTNIDGLYVYLITIDNIISFETPIKTREGILDWKQIEWISNKNNTGVCYNIPYFIEDVLYDNEHIYEHKCDFEGNNLLSVTKILFKD